MLWSDPDDTPSKELLDAQLKLRRMGLVVAPATVW
jgi:hypothetical protein